MNLVSLESLLNLLLDNAQISIFPKVDEMYRLFYWVTNALSDLLSQITQCKKWTMSCLVGPLRYVTQCKLAFIYRMGLRVVYEMGQKVGMVLPYI